MRCPAGIDDAIQQEQRGALLVLGRIEDHIGAVAIVTRSGIGRLNIHRTAEQFRAEREIERVQALVIVARSVFRHGHHVNRSIRTARAINHWGGGHADFRSYLAATTIVRCCFARFQHRELPDRCAGIRVEGVDGIVFGSNDQHVVRAVVRAVVRNYDVGGVERFGVDQTIDRVETQLAKLRRGNVAGGQRGFCQVLSRACNVVVVGEHVGSGWGCGIHRETNGVAGCTSRRVADHDSILRATFRGRGRSRGVACRGRTSDRGRTLLPLVTQGSDSRCRHRECCRLPGGNRLVRRLLRNRGGHGSCVYGQCGGIAGDVSRRILYHDAELCTTVRGRSRSRRIAGRGRSRNCSCTLLPLVTQGSGSRCRHRECRRLSGSHGLVRGLSRNRGSGGAIAGPGCVVAGCRYAAAACQKEANYKKTQYIR